MKIERCATGRPRRTWAVLLFAWGCAPAARPPRAVVPIGAGDDVTHEEAPPEAHGDPPARYGVGDAVQLSDAASGFDQEHPDCAPFSDEGKGSASPPRAWLGTYAVFQVVATSACKDGRELLLVELEGQRGPLFADRVRRVPTGCPAGVGTMFGAVVGAWDACYAQVPSRIRGSGPAEVQVQLDENGKLLGVAWRGGTGWGPDAATCMLRATEQADLDGRACAGETVRLSKWYTAE